MTAAFEEYMLAARKISMKTLYSYDRELGRLYLDLATKVKAELLTAKGFEQYHLRGVLRALTDVAWETTKGFSGIIDKAMLEAAKLDISGVQRGMKGHFDILERVTKLSPEKMIYRIPEDAVRAIYARTYSDGLYLSDRIWNLGTRTQSGLSRLVTEGVARGFHFDDPRIAQQVDRFLQPARMGKKVKPSITRTIKARTPEQAAKHGVKVGDTFKYTYRQRPVSYDAARLLRTEYMNASREADLMAARKNPACTGEEWSLSPQHPDIGCDCENYAVHDEGLGEGVFSLGNVPVTPHASCLCNLSQVTVSTDVFMGWAEDFMAGGHNQITDWWTKYGDELVAA